MEKEHEVPKEIKGKVMDIVNSLKKKKEVKSIILFGSYVKGKEKPISDIDICVLTEENVEYDVKTDIVSYSSEEMDIVLFVDLPQSLRYEILKEGTILYNKDKGFLHEKKVETMDKYLDFKHILERNKTRVLG